MSDYNEITAVITTEEPEIAVSLDELRYLVFEGQKGDKGDPGTDGHSPTVQVTNIPGGNRVTITDKNGPKEFEVDDGISPSVLVADITGGHRVTITDKTHPSGQTFDVMDGDDGGSGDFVLLHADDERRVFNGTTPITGAQIYALAGTGKAVFLWDEDGEYLYTIDTVHNGDVYFFMPAFDGNGFYTAVVNENNNECSFSSRPAIPRASVADAGKILTVNSNGEWAAQTPSGSADAVLYTPMSLTPAQQEQARSNIGAASMSDIPSLAAYRTASAQDAIDAAQDSAIAAKYTKPSGGIPASDLASPVQTSLGKADTALQTAPVTSVNSKTGAVALTASDVGALPDDTVIPVVPQMATQADMSDWTSGKTVDAATLKTDFNLALLDLDDLHVNKADKDEIPTAVSELTNDSGYQTAAQVQTAIAGVRQLPTVTASDNGKVLAVDNGEWSADSPVIVSGTDAQVANAVNDYLTQYGVPLRLSEEIKQALLDCFGNVAWVNDDGQTYYDALYAALYNEPAPPSPVPNEYQRVEWVGTQNSSIAYILTGISESGMAALAGYSIHLTAAFGVSQPTVGIDTNGSVIAFSSKAGTYFGSLKTGRVAIGISETYALPSSVVCTNKNDYIAEYSNTGLTISSNNQSVSRNYSTSGDTAQELTIGTGSISAGNVAEWSQFYSVKVYKNETLVADFFPVYRISDGVIGFYDAVRNQFYTNSGSGSFVKGGDIA